MDIYAIDGTVEEQQKWSTGFIDYTVLDLNQITEQSDGTALPNDSGANAASNSSPVSPASPGEIAPADQAIYTATASVRTDEGLTLVEAYSVTPAAAANSAAAANPFAAVNPFASAILGAAANSETAIGPGIGITPSGANAPTATADPANTSAPASQVAAPVANAADASTDNDETPKTQLININLRASLPFPEDESLAVYRIKKGRLDGMLKEDIKPVKDENVTICLDEDADGFAIVRDNGYRQMEIDAVTILSADSSAKQNAGADISAGTGADNGTDNKGGTSSVVLKGTMPKGASVEVTDASGSDAARKALEASQAKVNANANANTNVNTNALNNVNNALGTAAFGSALGNATYPYNNVLGNVGYPYNNVFGNAAYSYNNVSGNAAINNALNGTAFNNASGNKFYNVSTSNTASYTDNTNNSVSASNISGTGMADISDTPLGRVNAIFAEKNAASAAQEETHEALRSYQPALSQSQTQSQESANQLPSEDRTLPSVSVAVTEPGALLQSSETQTLSSDTQAWTLDMQSQVSGNQALSPTGQTQVAGGTTAPQSQPQTQSQPSAGQFQSSIGQAQPFAGQAQSSTAQTQPSTGQQQSSSAQIQPTAEQTQSLTTQTQPTAGPAQPQPSYSGRESGSSILAAFDITIQNGDTKYQPTAARPIAVSITDPKISKDKDLELWHVLDDGTLEEIGDFTIEGNTMTFYATSFSVYVIIEYEISKIIQASDGNTYNISVTYDNTAGLPADAELEVTEILGEKFSEYEERTAAALGAEAFSYSRFFDISIVGADGAHYQPNEKVAVSINLLNKSSNISPINSLNNSPSSSLSYSSDNSSNNSMNNNAAGEKYSVVHFTDNNETEIIESEQEGDTVTFLTDGFSVYAVVAHKIEQTLTASDGNEYLVTVTYDNSAGIPEDAELIVTELLPGDEGYEEYVSQSTEKLGISAENVSFARAFDITLKNPETGEEYQPNHAVSVSIELLSETLEKNTGLDVVHFGDEPEVMETSVNGEAVVFETDGFSVYVVIGHEGEEIVTPRVEFHFIAGTSATPVTEDSIAWYTADPYTFGNTATDSEAGRLQRSLIVRDGDTLETIEAPEDLSEDVHFFGWYTVTLKENGDTVTYNAATHTYSGQIQYSWPDDTERVELDNTVSITNVQKDANGAVTELTWTVDDVTQTVTANIDADGCAHVYLAPIYSNYHFVNFHLAPYEDPSAAYILVRKLIVLGNSNETNVRIGDVNSGHMDPDFFRFVGWQYYNGTGDPATDTSNWVEIQTVEEDDTERNTHPGLTGSYLTAGERDYDLYPIFVEIRWVTFNRGAAHNGSDYLAPVHIRTSDSSDTTYPVDSFYGKDEARRVGYVFGGWYLDAYMGNGSDILNIDDPVTVTVNGETKTYPKAIQLTDADGNFVDSVKGQVFYKSSDSSREVLQCAASDLPAGAIKLYEVKADGKFYIYSGYWDRLPVCARWDIPSDPTDYKVVIWKQQSTDSVDALSLSEYDTWKTTYTAAHPDAEKDEIAAAWDAACKHYDFYTYEIRTGQGNSRVSPSTADLGKLNSTAQVTYNGETVTEKDLFVGFQRGEYDSNVTVDPQGTTVLNVYYDRKPVTLTFQVQDYTYTVSNNDNDNNPVKYGDVNGQKARVYWRNGAFRTNDNNNGTVYTGTVYTRSNNQSWQTIKEIKALYEHNISDQFPIVGTNGVTYNNGERWDPQGYGNTQNTFNQVLVNIDVMPKENVTFHLNTSTATKKTIHYYIEPLPGQEGTRREYNGKWFIEYNSVSANYNFFTEAEDYIELIGFSKSDAYPPQGFNANGTTATRIWDNGGAAEIYCYYLRNTYDLFFMPNYAGEIDATELTQETQLDYVSGMTGAEKKTFIVRGIPYGSEISDNASVAAIRALQGGSVAAGDKYPLLPPEHKFDGWFIDASTTSPFKFDSTMPAGNVVIYAGMSMIKYRVLIDPNGGVMDHINYPVYGSILNNTGLPTDSNYNDAFATYFNNTAAEFINTDQDLENPMVQIDSAEVAQIRAEGGQVYRYVNMQYDRAESLNGGIYASYAADARNALYILDTPESIAQYYQYYCRIIADKNDGTPIPSQETWESLFLSSERYRKLRVGESYTFLGWYELNESTGELDANPYDFSKPTSHRTHLIAKWRLEGGFTLKYTPNYDYEDNGTVYHLTGNMEEFLDPDPTLTSTQYADGADTQAMEEPKEIKINGEIDSEGLYQFRGWQIVRIMNINGENHYTVPDEEAGKYYTAGQSITVHGRYAQEEFDSTGTNSRMVIHLRAVYEKREEAYRRPVIVNLTMDASKDAADQGQGYLKTSDIMALPSLGYPGHQYIDTLTKPVDGENQPYRILIGDAQSNEAVHLHLYAANPGETGLEESHNYFVHSEGYKLLGFDLDAPDDDFAPQYPADAVVAVSPNSSHTLYAVWEPMVYVTFVNDTGIGPVHFNLQGQDNALYVVNKTDGSFSREAYDVSSGITLADGESLRLAVPYGKDKTLTVTGINDLPETGVLLSARSELRSTARPLTGTLTNSATDYSKVPKGHEFGFSDTMVEDQDGIIITFTADIAPHTLVLQDNWNGNGTGGSTTEVTFSKRASDGLVYFGTESVTSYTLPSTSTRIPNEFLGWAETPDATVPQYSAMEGWKIDNLTDFFRDPDHPHAEGETSVTVKYLYAVWTVNTQAGTVNVWKIVEGPAVPDETFSFKVEFGGKFDYQENTNGSNNGWSDTKTGEMSSTTDANGAPKMSGTYSLKNGEYLKLVSKANQVSSISQHPYLQIEVYHCYRDENNVECFRGAAGQNISEATPIDTLRWEWKYYNYNSTNYSYRHRNFSFKNLSFTVTEIPTSEAQDLPGRFDTKVTVNGDTAENPLTPDSAARRVSWTSYFAGGTVSVTNAHKTGDVTVQKTLLPEGLDAETFTYSAALINGSGQPTYTYEGYTMPEADRSFTVTSGTAGHVIAGIPTGATLQLTEITGGKMYNTEAAGKLYITTPEGTVTEEDVSDLDTTDAGFRFAVAGKTTVTYTNTLKSHKVRIVLKDDEGTALSGGTFTLLDGFEGTQLANASGLIWEGELYYRTGTYTLTEQNSPGVRYRKLISPVAISVDDGVEEGVNDGVRVTPGAGDNDYVNVTYDAAAKVYIITVINPKLIAVKVTKQIDAASSFFKTGTFAFTATLTDVSDPANPKPVQAANVIESRGTDPGSGQIPFTLVNNQSVTLYVPKGIRLTIAETADTAFITKVQVSNTEAGLESAAAEEQVTAEINTVTTDRFVRFINQLKTVDITVVKEVEGKTEPFAFTAVLTYNGRAVSAYTLKEGSSGSDAIVTGNGEGGSVVGRAAFSLEPEIYDSASVTLTIPAGAVLVLEEDLTEAVYDGYISSYRVVDSSDIVSSSGTGGKVNLSQTMTRNNLTVTVTNARPVVCKLTNASGDLLYERGTTGKYYPAVYESLKESFDAVNDNSRVWYLKSGDGFTTDSATVNCLKMLCDYEQTQAVSLNADRTIVFTTAETDDEDYPSNVATATVTRGFNGPSLITNNGTLTLENIHLDGAKATYSANTDGGLIYVADGKTLNLNPGTTLQNSHTNGSGGAIYAANGASVAVNGGGSGADARISGNTAGAAGAGIYLQEGAKLRLSGSPNFGGTDRNADGTLKGTEGNFLTGTLTGSTNGGQPYTKARQDIYIAGTGSPIQAITLTGNLTGDTGSIWVWAEHQNHYETLKQFAVIDFAGTVTDGTYLAFRNARPDADTLCNGDYLSGQSGDDISGRKCIYWSNTSALVMFKKIDGNGEPLAGAQFSLYSEYSCTNTNIVQITVDDTKVNYVTSAASFSTTDGIEQNVSFKVAPGVYYMKETVTPDGYKPNAAVYRVIVGDKGAADAGVTLLTGSDFLIQRMANATTPENPPDIAEYGVMNISEATRKVILKKVNTIFTPLPGAEFQILRYDRTLISSTDINGVTTTTFTSGSSGVYFIDRLPFGTYYLHETMVPDGYQSLADGTCWFQMTVNGDGITVVRLTAAP